jgi:hypothetical protein
VHHKFRVHQDPERAGVPLAPEQLRDATIAALRAEGLEVVLWQSAPLPAQTVFQRRDAATGFPQAPPGAEGGTDLATNYDPARYPRTRALLAGSLVLFSQSCPLIAQDAALVDRYAEAFERVWRHRGALAEWAARPHARGGVHDGSPARPGGPTGDAGAVAGTGPARPHARA